MSLIETKTSTGELFNMMVADTLSENATTSDYSSPNWSTSDTPEQNPDLYTIDFNLSYIDQVLDANISKENHNTNNVVENFANVAANTATARLENENDDNNIMNVLVETLKVPVVATCQSPSSGKGRIMYNRELVCGNLNSDDSDSSSDSDVSDEEDDKQSSDEDDDVISKSVRSMNGDDLEFSLNKPAIRIQPTREQQVKVISAVMLKQNIETTKRDLPKIERPKENIKVREYKHKYFSETKKNKIIRMCDVVFNDDPPESDSVMVYSQSLNLVSLREFIVGRSKIKNTFIQDKMITTPYGRALRKLSTNYPIEACQYKRNIVNNAILTPKVYTLVYGAVPDLMAFEYASYIILKHFKLKPEEKEKTKYIAEGELEIGAYCYTMLASLDLVKWRNDLCRVAHKKLLLYACTLIPDKALRLQVLSYINPNEPKYITAESMLLLKRDFARIISSLRQIPNVDASNQAITTWQYFMKKCNIHHYLCPHTLIEVNKSIKVVGSKLVYKVKELELQNSEYDMSHIKFSLEETKEYFNFIPYMNTATGESMKLVQKMLNTVYSHIVSMFADHLVSYGIYPTVYRINKDHVAGFAHAHGRLLSANNNNVEIPIMKCKFNSINSTLAAKVQLLRTEFDMERGIKMENDAIVNLMHVINMIILKRVDILMYVRNHDICLGRAVHHELKTLFESNDFTSVDNIEAWTHLDDDEMNEEDFSDEDDDDDDDDDYEYDEGYSNVDSDEEIIDLHTENELLIAESQETYSKPLPFVRRLKKNGFAVSNLSSNILNVTARNYKKVSIDTPYTMVDGKISRTPCVMCGFRRTVKALIIGSSIEVPCCIKCHRMLVIDFLSEERNVDHEVLKKRIERQYAIPVAFDRGNKFIRDEDFDAKKSRTVYNRIVKASLPPKKARKRPSPSTKPNNSRTKKPKSVAIVNIDDDDDDDDNEI